MHQIKSHKAFLILILCIIISSFSSFGQKLEIYSGPLYNHFYDYEKETLYNNSDYTGQWGYTLGFAIDSLVISATRLRFSLRYEHYGGDFHFRSGSNAGTRTVDGQIQKDKLSLTVFPINTRKLIPNSQISIGLTGSFLLHESFSGNYIHKGAKKRHGKLNLTKKGES